MRPRHLDGWAQTLVGQRAHRRALAFAQARGRLSERICRRVRGEYFAIYNERRLHQALRYRTPIAVWREGAGEDCNGRRTRPALEKGARIFAGLADYQLKPEREIPWSCWTLSVTLS